MLLKISGTLQCGRSLVTRWFSVLADFQPKPSDGLKDPDWENAKPFSKLPGPTKWQLIRGFLPGGKYNGMTIQQLNDSFLNEYGRILLFPSLFGKPEMIFTFSPQDIEKVFRTEGVWPQRKGTDTFTYYRQHMGPDIFRDQAGLLAEQNENWGKMRSKVNPVMLPPRTVKLYIPEVDSVANEFVQQLIGTRDGNNEVTASFYQMLNNWALESIGVIALNRRLGVLTNLDKTSDARKIQESIKLFFELSYELDIQPSIWKYYKTPKFMKLMGAFDTLTSLIKKYVDLALEDIEKQAKLGLQKTDDGELSVLEKLLKIDRQTAIIMAYDMLAAGVDTTSSATVSFLYCLAKNPEKQEKLRDEVRQILPHTNSKLTNESLNNIPYMRASFKESLRIAPVGAGALRTSGKDIVLSGYQIPIGKEVVMSTGCLQSDPNHYPKPDTYLPERWLKNVELSDCPSAKSANPFTFLPFGFGARSCIGQRFAEMEIVILIARILRQYKIDWNYGPIKYKSGLINSPVGDLKFKLTELPD